MVSVVDRKYRNYGAGRLLATLMQMGVVDRTLCNTLAVREFVAGRVKCGVKKVTAMREAADRFGCSVANVKKCEYYNKNVNLLD